MAAKIRPRKIYMPGDMGDRKAREDYRAPGPVVIVRKGVEPCRKSRESISG